MPSKDEVVAKERSIVSKLFNSASSGNGKEIESIVLNYSKEVNIPCEEVLMQFRDANKRTAIHFACGSGCDEDVIGYLLGVPWFSDAAKELFHAKDIEGVTPFMVSYCYYVYLTDVGVASSPAE